jgi:uncharacterized protein
MFSMQAHSAINQTMSSQAQIATTCDGINTLQHFFALLEGDCTALKRYIKDGGNVNAREEHAPHRTLLHVAGELQMTTAAQQLVAAGANVNALADDGITPLSAQSVEVAKLLLNSGADPELRDDIGRSALYLACTKMSAALAKLLLKRASAATITQATCDGFTPLSEAVRNGSEGLALLVLAAHSAEYDGNDALQASNVDTNLYTACSRGFVKLAGVLLKRGADVNRGRIAEPTRTPYMFAAQRGDLAMLDLLQQYGADVNAVSSDGGTALMIASSAGQALAVKRMLRHGVDVNLHAGFSDRTTAVYAAVLHGHIDTARVLLQAGV